MTDNSVPTIQLQLLGHFQLRRDDEVVTSLAQGRLQWLLAYLALHRATPQPRQHLAFLFWPDSTESQARTNLRRLLHDLRLALPDIDHYVTMDSQWLQWRPDLLFSVDVSEFEEHLAQAEQLLRAQRRDEALGPLERAVELYQGPFLRDSFEEWALATRTSLDERYAHTLQSLVDLHEERRNYGAAIAYGQRLLRHDPLLESAYRHLMRLHALNGDRAGALRLYHECAARLARELGVEPSAQTRAAHAQLLNAEAPATQPPTEAARPAVSQEMVGRQQEWQQLLQEWAHAGHGHARVVALTGEAGIGKTRLAQSLATWVRRQGMYSFNTRAYEAEGALAYAPIIELLRSEPLVAEVAQMDAIWVAPIARLLPELRERLKDLPPSEPLTEALQRQHFYEALARAVLGNGREAWPRLLLLDDMQWCDRETLEWLRYLLRFAPHAPLLVLLTVRSGEAAADHPLHDFLLALRSQHLLTEIALARLNQEATLQLATHLAGRTVAADQAARLYQHTEGNPFFVVEMMRANLAHWSAGGNDAPNANEFEALREKWPARLSLPDRVQAVILARLSQLSPAAREVAQVAATIGRSFSLDFLARAGGYGEDELVRTLDELWQRHIVAEQGASEYDFSHPLIRGVAYHQMSPVRRRISHRRIAQSLEALSAGEVESSSGLVAIHYELAGEISQAVYAYQRAARFAKQAYAYLEAATTLRKAAALLESLPMSEARQSQEIEVYLDLGWAMMMAKGWTSQEAQEAYDRALALCTASQKQYEPGLAKSLPAAVGQEASLPFDERIFEAFWGLHEIYLFRGNREKAQEASDLCWSLAQRSGDPEILLEAHHAYWALYFYFNLVPNSLQTSVHHAQRGIDLYLPQWHRSHLLRFGGHDPASCAYQMKAKALWQLGYPDQALAAVRAGIDWATQLQHPFSLRQALSQAAKIHGYRGEAIAALECVEKALQISKEQGGGGYDMERHVVRGWALAHLGQAAEVPALVQEVCSRRLAEGAHLEMPYYLALLAEIYEQAGQIDTAQLVIQQAHTIAERTGDDHYLPELHRLAGKYLLTTGDSDAAQANLLQAFETAQAQGAKSLELRAALNLSQLWVQQGQQARAYELLAGVYNWFTEGFETADLMEAQALLQTLAPSQTVASA